MSKPARQSSRRPGGFQPPHCPNPKCAYHRRRPDWHFVRNGHHVRRSDQRRIQDYLCRHCGRRFCARAFATTYWLRRPDLFIPIAIHITEGACLRQVARILLTSHTTVARHVARLGRHCLLFHHLTLQGVTICEPLVVDGFESFVYSQYFPFHANLAVGADSWFLYHFTDAPLRRKGAMTAEQKRRREELETLYGRPDPKAVELGMAGLLRPLLAMLPPAESLQLRSDDHPAYRRSLQRLGRELPGCPKIDHCVTPSTDARTPGNPLFAVNLADLLLRHSSANHFRETISFSKHLQAALLRLASFLVWRNYIKKRREKESAPAETAAMRAGVRDGPLEWRQVLARRMFPERAGLSPEWLRYYWGKVKTAVYGSRQREHRCQYAF